MSTREEAADNLMFDTVHDEPEGVDKIAEIQEASSDGGGTDKLGDKVRSWLVELSAKNPSEQLAEIAQAYANMLTAAEMAVAAETKIQGLQRFLMALTYRNAGDLVILDSEQEELEGIFSITRTVAGNGTCLSIRPHPPETAPS